MTTHGSKHKNFIKPAGNLRLLRTTAFIGLMGAGKTKIGQRMARLLNVPFFDSDHEVEAAAGMSVSDIFAIHGESAFRDAERKVIARLMRGPVSVIATGGGSYMNEQTRAEISAHGKAVWLRASLDVLEDRTSRSNRRPLLAGQDARAILAELIEKRYPTYALADIIIDSDNRPADSTAMLVLQTLIDAGVVIHAD